MSANEEVFTDLKVALEWGAGLELTDEQRATIKPLLIQLAGNLGAGEPAIPPSRLRAESEKKRQALVRAEKAERRLAEVELALKASREWLRTKPRLAR
jgi:hypothetical protein